MRIPLATTLKNRRADTDKDPRLLNCVVDSKKRVLKRPCLVGTYEVTTPGAGLGLFVRTTPGAPGVPATPELVTIVGSILTANPSVFVNATNTLISAEDPFNAGRFGFEDGTMGSLTPQTYLGESIYVIATEAGGTPTVFQMPTSGHTQDFFTSITIGSTTLLSADAVFSLGSSWVWHGVSAITGTGTYKVAIV